MPPAHTAHTAPGAHSSVHTSPAAAFAQFARYYTVERGCMRSVVAHYPPLDPLTHRLADRPGTHTPLSLSASLGGGASEDLQADVLGSMSTRALVCFARGDQEAEYARSRTSRRRAAGPDRDVCG
jgi:hypothetical protein